MYLGRVSYLLLQNYFDLSDATPPLSDLFDTDSKKDRFSFEKTEQKAGAERERI